MDLEEATKLLDEATQKAIEDFLKIDTHQRRVLLLTKKLRNNIAYRRTFLDLIKNTDDVNITGIVNEFISQEKLNSSLYSQLAESIIEISKDARGVYENYAKIVQCSIWLYASYVKCLVARENEKSGTDNG